MAVALALAIAVALAITVAVAVTIATAVAITIAVTVALSDSYDVLQRSIPGMGLSRNSVFAVTLSHALAITNTQSVAVAITYTFTGTDATPDPCTGALRDQLSRRAGHVIQKNLH